VVRSLKALLGHGFFRPPDSSKVTGVYELVLRQKLYAVGKSRSLLYLNRINRVVRGLLTLSLYVYVPV